MHIQGNWVFEGAEPQSISIHLFNPSKLVRLIPDVHHVIRKSADRILCVLHPQVTVLHLDELIIDISRDERSAEDSFNFQMIMRSGDQRLFEGHGSILLEPVGQDTHFSFELSGTCYGSFLTVGQQFIETQIRAGWRRFLTNLQMLLNGQIPITTTAVPVQETSKEVVAIVIGLLVLIIGWLIWRGWRKYSLRN
ncbi:MAG: hypothetical protein QNJ45_09645 [Ardenticatenaceae bacterium]|nr:hypothetical protein [Ardenticatenaceae bacterium]